MDRSRHQDAAAERRIGQTQDTRTAWSRIRGLIPRSLAASDPQYRGRYTGDGVRREGAYHQGTVWPWLMGPFITAYIKVNRGSESARRQAEAWLAPLKDHLADAGLGHISEIFEGDPPHRPVGCIAQAWSVAEILRVTVEDIYGIRPQDAAFARETTLNRAV